MGGWFCDTRNTTMNNTKRKIMWIPNFRHSESNVMGIATPKTQKKLWATPTTIPGWAKSIGITHYARLRATFWKWGDLETHIRYRRSNEHNPFGSHTRPCHIDSRTLHGYGIPLGGIQLFTGEILFGKCTLKRNCAMCDFKRAKYARRQVSGHVRSTHCYNSSNTNERWDIPFIEQYQYPAHGHQPRNVNESARFGISTDRIRPQEYGGKTNGHVTHVANIMEVRKALLGISLDTSG